MISLQELVRYSNQLLAADTFRDYCPNGLQVEGREDVRVIVSGVTASLALIEAAIEEEVDVLLVHHGYFWKGEDACVTGMKQQRLKRLLESGTSLLAYHLPLDAHDTLGNNVQLAQQLGLHIEGRSGNGSGPDLLFFGGLDSPLGADALAAHIQHGLQRMPQHIAGRADVIRRVAWCTGAAQSYIEAAAALGVDAFISGEISEPTVHVARECGIHYFSAGHHATERYGVQALGEHLAGHFGLEHRFVDIDNPV